MPTAKKTSAPRKTAASRSGNPANRASANEVSSVSDFKKKSGGIIELPSGVHMRLRNPGGMRVFIQAGTIPNSLMTIIQESLDKGKTTNIAEKIVGPDGVDEQMVNDMLHMLNVVIVECAVEPRVEMPPADESSRRDDTVYADEVDDEDKMFVFQWVTGGTRDLEQFRRELSEELGTLDGLANVGVQAKRPARARTR